MDKKIEKSNHQKIIKRIAKRLESLNFEEYKSSYFLRHKGAFIQYIHLHKFKSDSEYRVHLGVKLSNDEDKMFYLNGLESSPYQCKDSPNGKKYNFRFHKTDETIERCVENLFQFCVEVGEKWFEDWNDLEKLLKTPSSPLNRYKYDFSIESMK